MITTEQVTVTAGTCVLIGGIPVVLCQNTLVSVLAENVQPMQDGLEARIVEDDEEESEEWI